MSAFIIETSRIYYNNHNHDTPSFSICNTYTNLEISCTIYLNEITDLQEHKMILFTIDDMILDTSASQHGSIAGSIRSRP